MPDQIQGSVVERLTRIETKVNTICRNTADQETRIRGLEKTKWLAIGIALAVSSISSVALGFIIK